MAYYRLYFLNRQTARIESFEEFEAASDFEAVQRAELHAEKAPVELWCGARKIHRTEPEAVLRPASDSAQRPGRPLLT